MPVSTGICAEHIDPEFDPVSLHEPTCTRVHASSVGVRVKTTQLIAQIGGKALPFPVLAYPGEVQNYAGLHSLSAVPGTWDRTGAYNSMLGW